MLYTLSRTIKDTFLPIYCRYCDFKSVFAFCLLLHLFKHHNIKITKRDWKFLVKYNFLTRLIKTTFAIPLFIICLLLKIICIPFVWLDDIL